MGTPVAMRQHRPGIGGVGQVARAPLSATLYRHFATAPIPLTEDEGQQLLAVVHAIAARITLLVNAPTEVDAADPPA